MTEIDRLIERYRARGLVIDANLLPLLVVGMTNPSRVERFSRTQMYSLADFGLVAGFASQFQKVITTPHVLTEVSNLANLKEPELGKLRSRLRMIVEQGDEIRETASNLMQSRVYTSLGLGDAAVANAANQRLLLTDDLDLYCTVRAQGGDAVNFNHIRPL